MKKIIYKYGKHIASLALLITAFNVNTTCTFMMHQPQVPKSAEKLHKLK